MSVNGEIQNAYNLYIITNTVTIVLGELLQKKEIIFILKNKGTIVLLRKP